jgi:hypothetical protein
MTADDGEARRGGSAMGGRQVRVSSLEEGGTGDEVVGYGSSRCGSLVFHMREPGGKIGIKIALYQSRLGWR